MKKYILKGSIALLAALSPLLLWELYRHPKVIMETVSPTGTHRVTVTRESRLSSFFGGENTLRFDLCQADRIVLADALIDQSAWYDNSIYDNVAENFWESDSILRFRKTLNGRTALHDYVIILNTTQENIKYLKIGAGDILLVIDLKPNSVTKFPVPRQKWQSWLTGEGRFENGEPIPFNGVDFVHKDEFRYPLTFCFQFRGRNLDLRSPDLTGWRYGQPVIPPSPCKAFDDSLALSESYLFRN